MNLVCQLRSNSPVCVPAAESRSECSWVSALHTETYRRSAWFVLFTLHSATAVLRHLWLLFFFFFLQPRLTHRPPMLRTPRTIPEKISLRALNIPRFGHRRFLLLHLQDEFTQEGCASCHGAKANKRPILQQECADPPSPPLWISNVSPHAGFVAPHETSRVVSWVLRRRAESVFLLKTGGKTPRRSDPACWAASPLVNYEQVLLSGLSGGIVVSHHDSFQLHQMKKTSL